ncbi:MAG: glycosyltransferase, partial [Actinobacteria bacterium]|nr:glycosyltransferase [Actinomycetota bacterium]
VATTGGALPEVVGVSGETGILVEPNNPDALVAAIRDLLDNPAEQKRLGDAGRERVMKRFTWEVTARGTAACYDAILTGQPLPESMTFE